MLALLVLAMLSGGGGESTVRCTLSCYDDGRDGDGVLSCTYDEFYYSCPRRSVKCVDSDWVVCRPRAKTLFWVEPDHEWDGIVTEYSPPAAEEPSTGGGGEESALPYTWGY